MKFLEKEAKKFRLTVEDLHNLYDLLHIVDTPVEIHQDIQGTLKLNKMYEWVIRLRQRIEDLVIREIKIGEKKNDKL
jgi:hypothetical protein